MSKEQSSNALIIATLVSGIVFFGAIAAYYALKPSSDTTQSDAPSSASPTVVPPPPVKVPDPPPPAATDIGAGLSQPYGWTFDQFASRHSDFNCTKEASICETPFPPNNQADCFFTGACIRVALVFKDGQYSSSIVGLEDDAFAQLRGDLTAGWGDPLANANQLGGTIIQTWEWVHETHRVTLAAYGGVDAYGEPLDKRSVIVSRTADDDL